MQNIELENLPDSVKTSTYAQNREAAKKYLSRFVSYNLRALCEGFTGNSILYGFDCYILNINNSFNDTKENNINKEISILVTPGAAVVNSTLLILSKPQILTIDYEGLFQPDKLIVVLDFVYDNTQSANRQQLFHKKGIKYDLDGQYSTSHLLPPFSLKLFYVDTDKQVINSNGIVWESEKDYMILAVFDTVLKSNKEVFIVEQYIMTFRQVDIMERTFRDYGMSYNIIPEIIHEKVINNPDSDLLSIEIDTKVYQIPRFAFFPEDIKIQIFHAFKLQLSARHTIQDLPFYRRRKERRARISQIYHEHNN
jgi:hypothetical protein